MIPKINVNALRIGYYSDKYFLRTQEILMKDNYESNVHYQYFPRKNCTVCGIPHVLQILKECTGYYSDREKAWEIFSKMQTIDIYQCGEIVSHDFYEFNKALNDLWISKYDELEVYTIEEGSDVKDMEPVIGIIGNPKYFIHLETPTLGVLAQQSAVATSVRKAKNLLHPHQKLLFFPARFRHYASQAPDGYAAAVGGATLMSTDSNGEYWGYDGIGTIPHALIAAYGGKTGVAALKFDEIIDPSVSRIVLVDWDNDCIQTTLKVIACFIARLRKPVEEHKMKGSLAHSDTSINYFYQHLHLEEGFAEKYVRDNRHMLHMVTGLGKGKIFGVRFDTSGSLTDYGISQWGEKGVCKELVWTARKKFNELGLEDLNIIISGGFDEEKLKKFQDVPYDMVGIGSSIVNKFTVDYTADAVTLDGKPNAKVGRQLMNWDKMKKV